MIEICFNHKIADGVLLFDKISIGHGLPTHGQMDFITWITEEIGQNGQCEGATWRWGFGWWRVKDFFKRWIIK
jgi:hypothetical protein